MSHPQMAFASFPLRSNQDPHCECEMSSLSVSLRALRTSPQIHRSHAHTDARYLSHPLWSGLCFPRWKQK